MVADFGGGTIMSNAGALLLGTTDRHPPQARFAACFRDGRAQDLIEHTICTSLASGCLGSHLGYEEPHRPRSLRHHPGMAVLAGKMWDATQMLRGGALFDATLRSIVPRTRQGSPLLQREGEVDAGLELPLPSGCGGGDGTQPTDLGLVSPPAAKRAA